MLFNKQVNTRVLKAPPGQDFRLSAPDLPLKHFQDQPLSVLCHYHSCTSPSHLHSHWETAADPHLVLDGHLPSGLVSCSRQVNLIMMSNDPGMRAVVHAVACATLPDQPPLTSRPPLTPCSPPHSEFRLYQPSFP